MEVMEMELCLKERLRFGGFQGGSVVKTLPANVGDMGSIPDLGQAHMPRSNKLVHCN